jgi:hypothetical protein
MVYCPLTLFSMRLSWSSFRITCPGKRLLVFRVLDLQRTVLLDLVRNRLPVRLCLFKV